MNGLLSHHDRWSHGASRRFLGATAALALVIGGVAGFAAAGAAAPQKSLVPVLTSLKPNSGVAGQKISLVGTGFYSANHDVYASFGSKGAATNCPTRELCVVVVPAGLKGKQAVRLHIETGTSNALTFTYK